MKIKNAFKLLKELTEGSDAVLVFIDKIPKNKELYNKINFDFCEYMKGISKEVRKSPEKKERYISGHVDLLAEIKQEIFNKEVLHLKERLKKRVLIPFLHKFLETAEIDSVLKTVINRYGFDRGFKKIKESVRNQKSIKNKYELAFALFKSFSLFETNVSLLENKIKKHNQKYNDNAELTHLKDGIYYIKSTRCSSFLLKEVCSKKYCISYSANSMVKYTDEFFSNYIFFDFTETSQGWSSYFLMINSESGKSISVYDENNKVFKLDSTNFKDCPEYLSHVLEAFFNGAKSAEEIFENFFSKEDSEGCNLKTVISLIVKTYYFKNKKAARRLLELTLNEENGLIKDYYQVLVLETIKVAVNSENNIVKAFDNDALNLVMDKMSSFSNESVSYELQKAILCMDLSDVVKYFGISQERNRLIKTNPHFMKTLSEKEFDKTLRDSAVIELKYKTSYFTENDYIDISKDCFLKNLFFDWMNVLYSNDDRELIKDWYSFIVSIPFELLNDYCSENFIMFENLNDIDFAQEVKQIREMVDTGLYPALKETLEISLMETFDDDQGLYPPIEINELDLFKIEMDKLDIK